MASKTRRAEPVDEGIPNRKRTLDELHSKLSKALDFDGWGQPVEAVEHYGRVVEKVEFECDSNRYVLFDDEKRVLKDLQQAIKLRCRTLQDAGGDELMALSALRDASSVLDDIATGKPVTKLSIEVPEFKAASPAFYPVALSDEGDELQSPTERFKLGGSLLPCPVVQLGLTVLTVHISKIGLKDASLYNDPIITISVKDSAGSDVTDAQNTPTASSQEELYVHFNTDVYIQRPVEALPKSGAIFFEFKHYKAIKRKHSTRCFAFLEMDELKPGPACLELYQKPTNYKRRKLNLFTVKPLFLHLDLKLQKT